MPWRIPPIVSTTSRTFVKNAGIVWVRDRIAVLTTDKTSVAIPLTGQKTGWMTDEIGVN
jgi:hypothetical protein